VNTNCTAARRPLIAASYPLQERNRSRWGLGKKKFRHKANCPIVFSKQLQAIGGQRAAVLLEASQTRVSRCRQDNPDFLRLK